MLRLRHAGIAGLFGLCLGLGVAGCRSREPVTPTDAGPQDSSVVRDPDGIYQECSLVEGCMSSGQICFPVSGLTRQSAMCSFLCSDDDGCPSGGFCGAPRTSDDRRARCFKRCSSDEQCPGAFRCFRVGVMSTRGDFEEDLCFPG